MPVAKGTSASFVEKMKKQNKLWDKLKTSPKKSSLEDTIVEEGNYVCNLISARTGCETKSGIPYWAISLIIKRGPHAGGRLSKYQRLDKEVGIQICVNDLDALGYDTADMKIEDLEEVAKEISEEKPLVRVAVKKVKSKKPGDKRVFQNVFLNSLIEQDDDEEDEEEEEEEEEEDDRDEEEEEDEENEDEENEEDEDEEEEEEEDKQEFIPVRKAEPKTKAKVKKSLAKSKSR